MKTSWKEKIEYGSASLADAVIYSFMSVFLLFFLTTVAGIEPAAAGAIAAVGSVWNSIFNPLMGYMADRVYTKYGRRRPVIFAFSIPLAAVCFLTFTNVDLPASVKPIYYGALVLLYWTCYTGFFIPYLALGAEYTSDYDDRTLLRLVCSLFNMLGNAFCMVAPTLFVDFLKGRGLESGEAWSLTALILGIFSALTIFVTLIFSKDKDPACERPEGMEKKALSGIFSEYADIARLKPMKYLIVASLGALICYTMIMSDMVYYLTYNLGFPAGRSSLALVSRSAMGALLIPVVGKLVMKFDKRATLIGFYAAGAAGMFVIRFAKPGGLFGIAFYLLCTCVCTAIYWDITPGIFYDVCEYDKILNGRDRSASIVSFQGLVEALAAGIGGQLLGIILQLSGFRGEAETQSARALLWITNSGTVIPVLFLMVAAAALYLYPLTKSEYDKLLDGKAEN